jgi:hypothetical protein
MVPIMMTYRMKLGMAKMLPLIITPTLNSPLATIRHLIEHEPRWRSRWNMEWGIPITCNFFAAPSISPRLAIHIFHTVFIIPLALSGVPSYVGSTLLAVLGISIFVCDVINIGLVYRKSKEEGINPWRRV